MFGARYWLAGGAEWRAEQMNDLWQGAITAALILAILLILYRIIGLFAYYE